MKARTGEIWARTGHSILEEDMKVTHGWHWFDGKHIPHSDFWYEGGYCRFHGHHQPEYCYLLATGRMPW